MATRHIRERLDRAVANTQWSNMFPQSSMINSEMIRSDHRPILMDTQNFAPAQAALIISSTVSSCSDLASNLLILVPLCIGARC